MGPAPTVGSDSPAISLECAKDVIAPTVASWLTLIGDGQSDLAALP